MSERPPIFISYNRGCQNTEQLINDIRERFDQKAFFIIDRETPKNEDWHKYLDDYIWTCAGAIIIVCRLGLENFEWVYPEAHDLYGRRADDEGFPVLSVLLDSLEIKEIEKKWPTASIEKYQFQHHDCNKKDNLSETLDQVTRIVNDSADRYIALISLPATARATIKLSLGAFSGSELDSVYKAALNRENTASRIRDASKRSSILAAISVGLSEGAARKLSKYCVCGVSDHDRRINREFILNSVIPWRDARRIYARLFGHEAFSFVISSHTSEPVKAILRQISTLRMVELEGSSDDECDLASDVAFIDIPDSIVRSYEQDGALNKLYDPIDRKIENFTEIDAGYGYKSSECIQNFIVTANGCSTISECIIGSLRERYKNIRIAIIDNGPTQGHNHANLDEITPDLIALALSRRPQSCRKGYPP